jgi:hypothetical protein
MFGCSPCTYLGEVVAVVMYSFFIILETCPRPARITCRTCRSIQNYYNGGLANLEQCIGTNNRIYTGTYNDKMTDRQES